MREKRGLHRRAGVADRRGARAAGDGRATAGNAGATAGAAGGCSADPGAGPANTGGIANAAGAAPSILGGVASGASARPESAGIRPGSVGGSPGAIGGRLGAVGRSGGPAGARSGASGARPDDARGLHWNRTGHAPAEVRRNGNRFLGFSAGQWEAGPEVGRRHAGRMYPRINAEVGRGARNEFRYGRDRPASSARPPCPPPPLGRLCVLRACLGFSAFGGSKPLAGFATDFRFVSTEGVGGQRPYVGRTPGFLAVLGAVSACPVPDFVSSTFSPSVLRVSVPEFLSSRFSSCRIGSLLGEQRHGMQIETLTRSATRGATDRNPWLVSPRGLWGLCSSNRRRLETEPEG
jgi:hypothetical protein